MKVLLVSSNQATTPYPVFPLGLAVIAAAIERAGHEVRLFDWLERGSSRAELHRTVREFGPGLVGISVRNIDNMNPLGEQRYVDDVRTIVTAVREISSAPVLLGGSGFSILPERILAYTGADYGIAGEGEQAAVAFVETLASGRPPAERCVRVPPSLAGSGIGAAHYDRDLMSYYLARGGMASVQTKRGCPHHCLYCSYPTLEGHALRAREPAAVADDIERLLRDHGAHYLFFTDSVFNDPQGLYLEVVREMRRRSIRVPWTAFFRPSGLDAAVVKEMMETGLSAMELGADAACDTTLRALGKEFLFDDVLSCNAMLADLEVPSAHYFMFGGPGETPGTVAESIRNIRRLRRTVNFIFPGVRILPGTPLATLALREGVIAPGQDLMEPVYYHTPEVDRAWMERTLLEAFGDDAMNIYPPDRHDHKVRLIHEVGLAGPAWDLLLKKRGPRRGEVQGGTGTHG